MSKWRIKYRLLILAVFLAFGQLSLIAQTNQDALPQWVKSNLTEPADTIEVYKKALLLLKRSSRENTPGAKISAYLSMAIYHDKYGHVDSSIYYYLGLKEIYKAAGNEQAIAETCLELKRLYGGKAAYDESMNQVFEALKIYEENDNQKGIALCYTHLSDLLYYEDKYKESVEYCDKAIDIQTQIGEKMDLAASYRYKAASLLFIDGELDYALETVNKAIEIYDEEGESGIALLATLNGRGNILKYMERYDEAITDYKYIYDKTLEMGLDRYVVPSIANIGHVYVLQKKYKQALPYNLEAIRLMKASESTKNLWENYMHVSDIYAGLGDYKNAYDYNILYSGEYSKYLYTIIDRLEAESQIKYETAKKDEKISAQEDTIDNQRKTQLLYLSIAVLLIASLIGMYQSRKNIAKKQLEIEKSKEKLQVSLESLKATQAQLIHAEKMASLGELTAGIAHEIQNPLNFVNNFSEVNAELLSELKEEIAKGDMNEVQSLVSDLLINEEKINHHGKRADGIVKGMLQHSRSGSNEKEPTNINVLADEYLRLAYHGLRAKDKSFNADFKLDLDESLPEVNVVSQEIGRVLLNLINNAFYAVSVKQAELLSSKNITGKKMTYKPLVTVSTEKISNQVEIKITDNGDGIPEDIKAKIFQPFFTTKPTGEGTGLGLSMSYDIITKGHGGDILVESARDTGTTFILTIPILN